MDINKFKYNFEYLINIVKIPRNIVVEKPILLTEIDLTKEFYETCINVGFNISNITNSAFSRGNLKQFITILNSKEFSEHPELFTSQVLAHSTPEGICDILSMSEWNDDRYKHLLKSGILLRTKDKLSSNIKLAENYGIDNYITINYLKKSISQNYALINYLLDNNINIIENGKLNSIFAYQPGVMLKKYGIDLKQLMEIYPYDEGKDKNAVR